MKLILCGDIAPTAVTVSAFDHADLTSLMGKTLSVIERGDFAVANLECALTDSEARTRKLGPNLKGKPAYAQVIHDCGFTHLGMSNNHVLDFGISGMRETVSAVRNAGIECFGFGENDQDSRKPCFIEKAGQRIAVVAVCEHEYSYALRDQFGANPFDPFDTMEDISEAKKNADFVIVMYHGGKEQCQYPSPRLRKACRAMVRAGADIILCQHSHCVGCREMYKGSLIVYGQGNFNFVGHPDHPHWKNGLILEADFDREIHCTFHPVVTTESGIDLAGGKASEEILLGFGERSRILQDEDLWLSKWQEFVDSVPHYLPDASGAFQQIPDGELCRQVFPHYLDCEAHLDVWKTLFKTWHAEKRSDA